MYVRESCFGAFESLDALMFGVLTNVITTELQHSYESHNECTFLN